MKIYSDNNGEFTRVEIIPLLDVMFCLLTFFLLLVLQVTRYQGVKVTKEDIPQIKTGNYQTSDRLIVSLSADSQVYVEGKLFGSVSELSNPGKLQQAFQQTLKNYSVKSPNGQSVLYAPKTVNYGDVIQTLDLLRLVLGDRVALGTLPDTKFNP
jgi:biopolymer transport protein ExbD